MDLMILVKNCLFKNSLGRKPKWGNLGGTWASGGTQAVLEQCLILLSWRSLPYTRKVKKHLIAKTVATADSEQMTSPVQYATILLSNKHV
jgi:hypothetical protein